MEDLERRLRAFDCSRLLEGDVWILIGTAGNEDQLEVAYGWGARLAAERASLELCVELDARDRTRANLEHNDRIAVSFADRGGHALPVQLKGRCLSHEVPGRDDLARAKRHRAVFCEEMDQLGPAHELVLSLWGNELTKLVLRIEQLSEEEHL